MESMKFTYGNFEIHDDHCPKMTTNFQVHKNAIENFIVYY